MFEFNWRIDEWSLKKEEKEKEKENMWMRVYYVCLVVREICS